MTTHDADPVLEYLKQFQQAVVAGFAAVNAHLAGHDSRFDTMDARLATTAQHFDKRFDQLRAELVAHMERLHLEVAGRLEDLEGPKRGNSGGAALTN